MIRRIVVLTAVLVVVFASAAHAQYDPPDPSISGSDATIVSGSTITVSATGCAIGSSVTFFLDGGAIGSAITDVDGVATASVTIVAAPGDHQISNSCNNAVFTLHVTAAGAVVGPPLARTGTDSTLSLTKVAAVAITAGGLLLIAARRRAEAHSQ